MRTILTCMLWLLGMGLMAQSPYSGGSGDGFATASLNGIDPAVGLEEIESVEWHLYPNPTEAGSTIFLSTSAQWQASEIELRNVDGHLLLSQWLPSGEGRHRLSLPADLPAGFYRLQLSTGEGLKLLVFDR